MSWLCNKRALCKGLATLLVKAHWIELVIKAGGAAMLSMVLRLIMMSLYAGAAWYTLVTLYGGYKGTMLFYAGICIGLFCTSNCTPK